MNYFKPDEFNHFDKMDKQALDFLDMVRAIYGSPFVVKGHSDFRPQSEADRLAGKPLDVHAMGIAIDFHIIDTIPLKAQTQKLIESCEIIGIPFRVGVYPHWNNPGFHLDILDVEKNKGKAKFWIQDKKGAYNYYTTKKRLLEDIGAI